MHHENFDACIFDFDGVIVDSEAMHAESKRLTLDHFGVPHPEDLFANFKGRPDSAFFAHVTTQLAAGDTSASQFIAHKQAVYLELSPKVQLIPGVQEFLAVARKRFRRVGLATSTSRRDFSLVDSLYRLTPWFDVVVTGDDTARHKPDPEPYLKAMAALGTTGATSLVIEDSPNGIRSARSAQCRIAALTTSFPAEALRKAGADLIVESYKQLERQLGL